MLFRKKVSLFFPGCFQDFYYNISTKEPLDESERGKRKGWLKTQHSKTEITASGTITSWKIDEESMKTVTDLIWGAPKSLQMVTAAMK